MRGVIKQAVVINIEEGRVFFRIIFRGNYLIKWLVEDANKG